jgi:hypothetical protein
LGSYPNYEIVRQTQQFASGKICKSADFTQLEVVPAKVHLATDYWTFILTRLPVVPEGFVAGLQARRYRLLISSFLSPHFAGFSENGFSSKRGCGGN